MAKVLALLFFVVLIATTVIAPSVLETPTFAVTLDTSPDVGGIVGGDGIYEKGSEVRLSASPELGYEFQGWFEAGERISTSPEFSFVVEEDRELEARFAVKPLGELEGDLYIKDGDYLFALVTKATNLGRYEPSDLVRIPDDLMPGWERYLREEALEHLILMSEAAEKDGVRLRVASAYRSYETQETIFARNVQEHGEEEANRSSARPGQSEHQLGTTVDFGGTSTDFTDEFGRTPVGRWLAENAHEFGFAMSYPENSEDITGYIYEPWHFRYIGVEAAREWEESGLTLTEFLMEKPQEFVRPEA